MQHDLATQDRHPRILVLGANGQVGFELPRLLRPFADVVTAARTCEWFTAEGKPLPVDLADANSLRALVRTVQPELIINAAAYTAVDKAESEPDLAHAVNAIAPGVLAEEAEKLGAGLIHYSTDYVFDGSGKIPWREHDRTGPLSVYGKTKLAGEEAIRATGVGHLILRTSWVYGVHGHNFVKTMLRLSSEKPKLSIVDDQIGAPTSARVIAAATAQIAKQAAGRSAEFLREKGGVIHLACLGETNWHEFAGEIFRLAAAAGQPLAVSEVRPIPTSEYPLPAPRPKNSRLNCRTVITRFGVRLPHWQEALQETFPDLLKNWLDATRTVRPPHFSTAPAAVMQEAARR